jgi:hypothetical protein
MAILTLFLLLGGQSSGAPPQQGQVLNRHPAGALSSAPNVRADRENPQFQRGDEFLEQQADEEKDFTKRLNRLEGALRDFSTTYNSGHVVDVKKVKAVRKAWVGLEKTGWFRGEKNK